MSGVFGIFPDTIFLHKYPNQLAVGRMTSTEQGAFVAMPADTLPIKNLSNVPRMSRVPTKIQSADNFSASIAVCLARHLL